MDTAKLAREWLEKWIEPHERALGDISSLTTLLDRVAREEGEFNWNLGHELARCGHPRANHQDRNWPESEKNYDPESKTSDPPMEYRCLACEALKERDAEWERVVREMFPPDVQEYRDADGDCKTLDRYWMGWTDCLDEILRRMKAG